MGITVITANGKRLLTNVSLIMIAANGDDVLVVIDDVAWEIAAVHRSGGGLHIYVANRPSPYGDQPNQYQPTKGPM